MERASGNETLLGYLVLVNDKVMAIPLKAVPDVAKVGTFLNARYEPSMKILEGTHGVSLTKYPVISKDYSLTSGNGLIVYSLVEDLNTNKITGVVAYNGIGQCFKLSLPKFLEVSNVHSNCNYVLKNDGKNGVLPFMVDGTSFPVIKMSLPPKIPTKTLHKGNTVTQGAKNEVPKLTVTTYLDDSVKQFDVDAQQKMTKAMFHMQYLTPYYHCCISAIKRVPAPGYGTFGVTEDTMFYDMAFVAELAIEELIFVMIHEMMHIAMQHSIRFGSHRTSHELWNIACDLYINSIICENFGIRFGGPAKTIKYGSDGRKTASIKTPEFGVYMETIGEKIDLSRDTPETIYDKLVKENPEMAQGGGSGKQGKGKGKGNKSNSKSGGKSKGKQQSSDDEDGENSQGSGSGSSSGRSSTASAGQNGMKDVSDQLNNNKTSGQTGMDDLTQSTPPSGSEIREVNVVYNGKRLKGTTTIDVMSNNDNKSPDSIEKSRQQSRSALQRIATKVKMTEQEHGTLEKTAGLGGELVSRYIEVGLSDGIRWQELLKAMLKTKPKKTFTLANPNTDYMNMGMTLADRRAIGKPTNLAGVIFAIDVSGSVTDTELNYTLSEVANIFNFFKVDAELIYWSTMVGNAGMFSSLKDLMKIDPVSDGGTDVKCVFDYITGKTRVNGKYEPNKLKDIKAVFILTDGMFSMNFAEYTNLGKKVVWLVTSNPITFNPPFGRVIGFKLP